MPRPRRSPLTVAKIEDKGRRTTSLTLDRGTLLELKHMALDRRVRVNELVEQAVIQYLDRERPIV